MDSLANYGSEDEYENDISRQSADALARMSDHGRDHAGRGQRSHQTHHHNPSPPQHARKEDDTNYDDVTMDMSEESYSDDSSKRRPSSPLRADQRHSHSSSSTDGGSKSKDRRQPERNSHRRDSYNREDDHYSRKSPTQRASNHSSSDRNSNSSGNSWKRGLLGDKPPDASSRAGLLGERPSENQGKPVALMDLKPFGGDPPAVAISLAHDNRQNYGPRSRDGSHRYEREDADRRDKDSDRDKRHKDSDRERSKHESRGKDKDRKNHSSGDDKKYSSSDRKRDRSRFHDKSSGSSRRKSPSNEKERERDRDRGKRHGGRSGDMSRRLDTAFTKKSSSYEKRHSKRSRSRDRSPVTTSDYKPSYMVSKKLQAMEKMGLQIKTPDGSMATAQMLMQRSLAEQVEKVKNTTGIELPKYYNPAVINPLKYAEQIQKRKLLWGNKAKEAPPADAGQSSNAPVTPVKPGQANKWQGTKFAEDSDGKVASKFMRLMGIKDPNAVQTAPAQQEPTGDIVKKQEEMFQVMQAQYEVARVTTHTMRGVGLGFSSFNRQY